MSPVRDFDDTLNEILSDPEQAAQYLRAAVGEGDSHALALAIQDVLHAVRPEPAKDAETEALCRARAGLKLTVEARLTCSSVSQQLRGVRSGSGNSRGIAL